MSKNNKFRYIQMYITSTKIPHYLQTLPAWMINIIYLETRRVFFESEIWWLTKDWDASRFLPYLCCLRCPYDVSLKRKGCLVNLFYDGKQEKEANIKISNMWRKTNPMNIYLQNSLSRIRISEVLYNMRSFFWTCIPAL